MANHGTFVPTQDSALKRDLAWNCALRGGATDNELELLKGLTALRNQFSHQSDAWAKPPSSQDNPASGGKPKPLRTPKDLEKGRLPKVFFFRGKTLPLRIVVSCCMLSALWSTELPVNRKTFSGDFRTWFKLLVREKSWPRKKSQI